MVMFADQYCCQLKAYPRVPYSIRKLVFHWKFWYQTWRCVQLTLGFCLKNAVHGSRMNTDMNLAWPLISSLLLQPIFVALNLFKSNFQGKEINPSSKNKASDSSYGAYPQGITAHEFPPLCCQVRCIKFWFWGFQASQKKSVKWTEVGK